MMTTTTITSIHYFQFIHSSAFFSKENKRRQCSGGDKGRYEMNLNVGRWIQLTTFQSSVNVGNVNNSLRLFRIQPNDQMPHIFLFTSSFSFCLTLFFLFCQSPLLFQTVLDLDWLPADSLLWWLTNWLTTYKARTVTVLRELISSIHIALYYTTIYK